MVYETIKDKIIEFCRVQTIGEILSFSLFLTYTDFYLISSLLSAASLGERGGRGGGGGGGRARDS